MTRDSLFLAVRWMILAPVTLLVAFGMTLLVLTAFSDSGRPRIFGLEMFVVTSGSMEPSIDLGDVIMVNIGKVYPVAGDVITFRPGEPVLFVTHRVVEVRQAAGSPAEYVTKGDANPSNDLVPVRSDQVVGAVTAVVPSLGWVVFGLRDPRFVLMMLSSVLLAELATTIRRRQPRVLVERSR